MSVHYEPSVENARALAGGPVALAAMKGLMADHPDMYTAPERAAIESYWSEGQSPGTPGGFRLNGQLLVGRETLLTGDLFRHAERLHGQRLQEYGGPTNQWEQMSIERGLQTFRDFEAAYLRTG